MSFSGLSPRQEPNLTPSFELLFSPGLGALCQGERSEAGRLRIELHMTRAVLALSADRAVVLAFALYKFHGDTGCMSRENLPRR